MPGLSFAGIRAIEAGERRRDYERFIQLARVLGLESPTISLHAVGLSAKVMAHEAGAPGLDGAMTAKRPRVDRRLRAFAAARR